VIFLKIGSAGFAENIKWQFSLQGIYYKLELHSISFHCADIDAFRPFSDPLGIR
jgi:hypothetical protein